MKLHNINKNKIVSLSNEYNKTYKYLNSISSEIENEILSKMDAYKMNVKREIIEEIKREYKLVPIDQN